MAGVARSTSPTRRVGEVLTVRWHKSMPGKSLVCQEYFAKPSGRLAKYSLPCGRVCPGSSCPGNHRPRTSDLPPSFQPGPRRHSPRAGGIPLSEVQVMMQPAIKLLTEALRLSPSERGELAARLIESLDP